MQKVENIKKVNLNANEFQERRCVKKHTFFV